MFKSKSAFRAFLIILILTVTIVVAVFYSESLRSNRNLNTTEVAVGASLFRVEVASTTVARARGLSGHAPLGENEGMLFLFDSFDKYGFWMKDMKFPIDIVWIKSDRVIGFAENVLPEPGKALWNLKVYYPPEEVDKVLEVNAGIVKKFRIEIGDAVAVRYPTEY